MGDDIFGRWLADAFAPPRRIGEAATHTTVSVGIATQWERTF